MYLRVRLLLELGSCWLCLYVVVNCGNCQIIPPTELQLHKYNYNWISDFYLSAINDRVLYSAIRHQDKSNWTIEHSRHN